MIYRLTYALHYLLSMAKPGYEHKDCKRIAELQAKISRRQRIERFGRI